MLNYRSLAESFLHRELRTRFLGSRFGWVWSLINPLLILAMYSVVFGIVLGANRGLQPSANGLQIFAIYLFTGLVCWNIFSSVLQRTIDGLVELIPLRRKVSFPILAPLVGMAIATLVERSAEMALLLVVYALLGNVGWTTALVPIFMLLVAGFAFGLGLIVAITNIAFRDIGHLVGVGLQLLFYATPVIYPASFLDTHLAPGSLARILLSAATRCTRSCKPSGI
ncbi:MAG: ABC transporter permease [Dermatophilaceae bacterium]